MKLIYICRHAKSSWNNPQLSDFERPLNERGLKTAPLMANFFLEQGHLPDVIISSTAVRAMSTAKIYSKALDVQIEPNPDLYHIDYMELFHYICALPNDNDRVAIVGHNPGLTNIVNYLSNYDLYNLSTSGIAAIQFDVDDWMEISAGTGTVVWHQYPKGLIEV